MHTLSGTGLTLTAGLGLVASSADRSPAEAARAREHGRETFAAEELAIVLSHFDVGPIEAIQEFRRGSRRSPKTLLKAQRGAFLLKRRAPGRDDIERVRFSHQVQLRLLEKGFPLPRLVRPRSANDTMVVHGGRVYELFEFIPGTRYDASLAATSDAGQALAFFHRYLSDADTSALQRSRGYHGASAVRRQFEIIAAREPENAALAGVCAALADRYEQSAEAADALGLREWPAQLVHGDWHPGNTLYRGERVVAVIDFDNLRLEPRVLDVANGALQFSIAMEGAEVDAWPDFTDESRFKRFCRAYDQVEGCILSQAEVRALPPLMIEALIVEAATPIAATGAFGGHPGGSFLAMIDRKTRWLEQRADELVRLVSG